MLPFANGETVTVIKRQVTEDPYGNETVVVTETDVDGVGVAPLQSEEEYERFRTPVVSGVTLYFPPDAAATPDRDDQVRARGLVFDVIGEPAGGMWRSPHTGRDFGMTITARRPEG